MVGHRRGLLGLSLGVVLIVWLLFQGCTTGIEPSPHPGILRVVLQSDPADTSILIVKQTFTVGEGDAFEVTVFQGRAYSDTTYGILFPTTESYREEQRSYNILERENDTYKAFVIFESHLPPGRYDSLQFGISAKLLKIGDIEVPVEIPQGVQPFVNLAVGFRVEEDRTTEVDVQLKPLESVHRYRDTYRFIPQVEVVGTKNF